MLRYYQKYTIDKFIDNQKCFICWNRQSGKDYTINNFLEYYVTNNSNKNIMYICSANDKIKNHIHKILKDIDHKVIQKVKSIYIDFINNNELIFSSINTVEKILFNKYDKYDLIIYNDIYKINNIDILNNYINVHKCKCIFSTWQMSDNIFKTVDYKNDFYINILTNQNLKKYDLMRYYNKSKENIDIFDTNFERNYKLKKLQDYEKENN